LKALLLTLIVDVGGSAAMFFAERNAPSTALHSFWDAWFWTSAQLTTLSSPMPNPVTTVGQAISLFLDLYAITVVATLAGMFSAFFHRRGEERDPRHSDKTT
jgi:hypothetical protein